MAEPMIDEQLLANLARLKLWCQAQDPNATIWLHVDEAMRALKNAERQRVYAIEWANRSVGSVKAAMWDAQDALRANQRT
jgi:hypothetical protein